MIIAGVADTHAALWLLFDDPRLSKTARAFIEQAAERREKIAVASITLAEIVYLVEKDRLPEVAYTTLIEALSDPEHIFTEAALTQAVVQSMASVPRADVPDMPDRIIAATAVHFGVPVISRDRCIASAKLESIW